MFHGDATTAADHQNKCVFSVFVRHSLLHAQLSMMEVHVRRGGDTLIVTHGQVLLVETILSATHNAIFVVTNTWNVPGLVA